MGDENFEGMQGRGGREGQRAIPTNGAGAWGLQGNIVERNLC